MTETTVGGDSHIHGIACLIQLGCTEHIGSFGADSIVTCLTKIPDRLFRPAAVAYQWKKECYPLKLKRMLACEAEERLLPEV